MIMASITLMEKIGKGILFYLQIKINILLIAY